MTIEDLNFEIYRLEDLKLKLAASISDDYYWLQQNKEYLNLAMYVQQITICGHRLYLMDVISSQISLLTVQIDQALMTKYINYDS